MMHYLYVNKFMGIQLFIVFPYYYTFSGHSISSDGSSFTFHTSYLCFLFFFASLSIDLYFLLILICLFMLLCITVYVMFNWFQISAIMKFPLLGAWYCQISVNILDAYSMMRLSYLKTIWSFGNLLFKFC